MRTLPALPNGHNHFVIPAPSASAKLPESPCSVNAFFEVEGYGRIQATGRGTTGEEAARHLRETITATRTALETPPVVSDEAKLGSLLTCGFKKAVAKGDEKLVERLSKAAAMVLAGAVSPGEREGMIAVQSQSCPSHYYSVDGASCTCSDWEYGARNGEKQPCKHVLAAHLWARIHS